MTPQEIDRYFVENPDAESFEETGDRPSLDSLKFDTTGFQYRGQKFPGRDHMWATPEGDTVALIFAPGRPNLPENAQAVDELRACCEHRFKMTGARIVELCVRRTNVRPAMQVIFKTQRGRGSTYTGSLCIPFQDFGFVIQGICEERGTIGMREALVLHFQDTDVGLGSIPAAEPACPPWEPDNSRFDGLCPDHPLSRLRRILDSVAESVEIDASIAEQPGFSLPACSV
jgi:hypothetical protein